MVVPSHTLSLEGSLFLSAQRPEQAPLIPSLSLTTHFVFLELSPPLYLGQGWVPVLKWTNLSTGPIPPVTDR